MVEFVLVPILKFETSDDFAELIPTALVMNYSVIYVSAGR